MLNLLQQRVCCYYDITTTNLLYKHNYKFVINTIKKFVINIIEKFVINIIEEFVVNMLYKKLNNRKNNIKLLINNLNQLSILKSNLNY